MVMGRQFGIPEAKRNANEGAVVVKIMFDEGWSVGPAGVRKFIVFVVFVVHSLFVVLLCLSCEFVRT